MSEGRFPRSALRATLLSWLSARALIALALVVSYLMWAYVIEECGRPPCIRPEYEPFWSTVAGHDQGLTSWDGWWYVRIARYGYTGVLLPEGLRYFPLYPLAGRFAAPAFGGSEELALLIITNAAALVLPLLLYRLARFEGASEALARRSIWITALAFPAFVLAMAYTEPIAMSLAVLVFMAMRSGRWWHAGAAGVLAGLVRPTGIFLMVPLAVEAVRGVRAAPPRERFARAAACLGPAAGTMVYLAWSAAAYGDFLLPLSVQNAETGRGPFAFPLVTMVDAAIRSVTEVKPHLAIHLVWAGVFIWLTILTFRRWPLAYGAFAAVSVLQSISTSNLNSLERYGYAAFPLILTSAALLENRSWRRVAIVVGPLLFTIYATANFVSGYIP